MFRVFLTAPRYHCNTKSFCTACFFYWTSKDTEECLSGHSYRKDSNCFVQRCLRRATHDCLSGCAAQLLTYMVLLYRGRHFMLAIISVIKSNFSKNCSK